MQVVFDFVEGLIGDEEFEYIIYATPEIWDWLQNLVPKDVTNHACEFRKTYPMFNGFETNNYNVKSTVTAFGYKQFIARALISALVKYNYPNVIIKTPITTTPDDLLEKMNLSYIGGKKADRLIRKILLEGSGESRKVLKERIKTVFMIENARKHPHWIQEPEWPFYDDRPMRFVSEDRNGELFTYYFVDDVTNVSISIEQYA